MKKNLLLLLALFCISISLAQTTTKLYQRTFIFNNGSLVSASPEQISLPSDSAAGNFHYGKNLLRLNGKYYHVYYSSINGNLDIFFHKSSDGINWTLPVQVNDDSASASQFNPSLALSDAGSGNSKIYVSWQDNRKGWYEMRFAKSTDDGQTFSPSAAISGNTLAQGSAGNISRDAAGVLYGLWNYYDGCWNHIVFTRSQDDGITWSLPVSIYSGGCIADQTVVQARNQGEAVVLLSSDQFNLKNVISLSTTDSGSTWQQVQATPYSGFQSICYFISSAVASNGDFHALFTHEVNGINTKILSLKSSDWGLTWGDSVRASDNTPLLQTWSYDSRMQTETETGGGSRLYAAWADPRYDFPNDQNYDVFLAASPDGGNTWNSNILVPQDTSAHVQAYISLCSSKNNSGNDTVLVIWNDNRVISTGISGLAATKNILVYPNPFEDRFKVYFTRPGATEAGGFMLNAWKNLKITVSDLAGKTVAEKPALEIPIEFDAADLANGIYLLKIISDENTIIKKIIKQ